MIDFFVQAKDDTLKILQLTDMQVIDSMQCRYEGRLSEVSMIEAHPSKMAETLFDDMDALVARTNPDLIIITGDISYGEFDDKGTSLLAFIETMEKYGIPWAPVWGNHDNETVLGVDWQCKQFENAKHCLFKKGNTVGCCNYTVGLKNKAGELVRVLYMLDSNGCGNVSELSLAQGVKRTIGFAEEQLAWVEENYAAICKEYACEVPTFACFHIEPKDYWDALKIKGYVDRENFKPIDLDPATGDFGAIHEISWPGEEDAPHITPTLKKINADGVFFGHSHVNDASVEYDGIRWTYGVKTGRYDYHEKDKLGGLTITLPSDGKNFVIKHEKI